VLFPILALGSNALEPRVLGAQNLESLATVQGQVVEHESGEPLPGATVTLMPRPEEPGRRTGESTGAEGLFSLGEVVPGLYDLRVTLLGYYALQDTLRVDPGSNLDLTLPLSVSPIPLDPIVVVSPRRPYGPMRAFETRRSTATGVFLGREEIQTSGALEFTDLLRRVPGARVVPTAGYGNRVVFRGGCRPDLWVDGVRANTTADLDSFLRPSELEGVEIYKGADLPMEFGSNLCGAIVVWTAPGGRYPADEERSGSFWKRLAWGAGLLLLGFLATH
jgi:hypothetical protein